MAGSAIHICTYFDVNYLSRGLTLYRSIRRSQPDATVWVLCLDEPTHEILAGLDLPASVLVKLPDVERRYPELLSVKGERRVIEYYFTLSPHWPSYVLEALPPQDRLVYADADIRLFSSLDPVFNEMGSSSVGIVDHRFSAQHANREVFGRFNVGTLFLRNDDNAAACLGWWRERCIEWCYDRLEGEKYADQKYLDEWPDRFEGVHIVTHPGIGVAPWNWMIGQFNLSAKPPLISGRPLITYHFHGLQLYGWSLFNPQIARYGRMPSDLFNALYGSYACDLIEVDAELRFGAAGLRRSRPVRQRRFTRFALGVCRGEVRRANRRHGHSPAELHDAEQ